MQFCRVNLRADFKGYSQWIEPSCERLLWFRQLPDFHRTQAPSWTGSQMWILCSYWSWRSVHTWDQRTHYCCCLYLAAKCCVNFPPRIHLSYLAPPFHEALTLSSSYCRRKRSKGTRVSQSLPPSRSFPHQFLYCSKLPEYYEKKH